MTSKPAAPKPIEAVDDPEGARLLTSLLENARELSKQMGSAQPVIEALSGSFAVMSSAEARAEYDDLRRLLVRYLESLDDAQLTPASGDKVEFQPSPDASSEDVVKQLLAAFGRPKPR